MFVLIFVLGFGAGFLGTLIYETWFRYLLGAIIIILGLHQMEIFKIKKLEMQKTFGFKKLNNSYLTAFVLGLTFSFGWTPCIGPVLSSVLALASSTGSNPMVATFLTILYAMGMSIPFLVIAFASNFVSKIFKKIKPYMLLLKKIGGFLIILMGILLILNQLNLLAGIFG